MSRSSSSNGELNSSSSIALLILIAGALILLGMMIGIIMYVGPVYGVWSAEQSGKAILAKAEFSRQAQVKDAQARLDSAKYLREAADEIQSSLSPEYLQLMQIQMMEEVGAHNDRAMYFTMPPMIAPVITTETTSAVAN